MKYMGRKSRLLTGVLGKELHQNLKGKSGRFFDVFAGSGAVSHFVAEKYDV